jgi:uroporphyrinogen decarboxylase
MRQAGRALPEYRALRERYEFLELIRRPELAFEVSLQPFSRFGMDAVILFSDILIPLPSMGIRLAFEEGIGPALERRIEKAADIERLARPRLRTSLPFTFEALEMLRHRLGDDAALLGFVGAPWTLACYMIQGGSGDFSGAVALAERQPELLKTLLDFLAEVLAEYAREQVRAGADAIQIFDTWGGLLEPASYAALAVPPLRRICEAVGDAGGIAILFIRESRRLLGAMKASGAKVASVGSNTPLPEAWTILGDAIATQGNLDPEVLLSSPASVAAKTGELLDAVRHRPGHIVNLGHGVLPETRPESIAAFVETVKRMSS